MDNKYYIYNNREKKTQQVSEDQYKLIHDYNYMSAQDNLEDKKQATLDYLNGIRKGTNVALPDNPEMYNREHDNNPKAELAEKRANAEKICGAKKTFRENADNNVKKYLKGNKYKNAILDGISAFMTGKKAADQKLIADYLSRDMDPAVILENCIRMFLDFPLENLDLSTDRNFANNSLLLERLNAQHEAVTNLVAENRAAYDNLPQKMREDFESRIGETNGLVNYYRLMSELLTDQYFVSHNNKELFRNKDKEATKEQKHLTILLTQSRAGLAALKKFGADIMDAELDKIVGSLNRTVVKNEQIELQRQLDEREKLVGKMGFSQYLDHLERKGSLDGMKPGGARSTFDRAKFSIDKLGLPERVENGAGHVIGILNQLELVSELSKQKAEYKNTFYLENNYRGIFIMEEVEKLSGPLSRMKNAILGMSNISEDGSLGTQKVTKDKQAEYQKIYSDALAEYQQVMGRVIDVREGKYLPLPKDEERMNALTLLYGKIHVSQVSLDKLKKSSPEEEKALREELKDLYLTLSENEYSDISIYINAPQIINLFVKCRSFLKAEEFNRLSALSELAYEIVLQKRTKDVQSALKQDKVIPQDELRRLQREANELKLFSPKDKAEKDKREKNVEKFRERQFKLRIEAQKLKFDYADRKAAATHYMRQDQWAENSKKASKGNIFKRFLRSTFSGITRFVGWCFSSTRSSNHGEVLYDRSRDNVLNLPTELNNFGEKNAKQTIIHGDGKYAPQVEINKYFTDAMKMELIGDYNSIRELADNEVEYPQCIKNAIEALGLYSQVRGVVNNDTFEMEQAFLDRFRKSVNAMLADTDITARYTNLSQRILKAYTHLEGNCHGTLINSISKEELEAAKEQPAIYTTKTYKGDTEESNVKDLPLFPHSPQLNDIKQGVLGNCYMLGAVQAVVSKNPKAIQDMFYDLGDGNVIVRFFAPYGVVDDQYVRIDDNDVKAERTMRPVYVKVRKHYTTGEEGSSCCLWMQLLEKAYAAAGFNQGGPEIDEKGELHNLYDELTSGDPDAVMVHLTGEMYYLNDKESMSGSDAKPQSVIATNQKLLSLQKRIIFDDVPEQFHNAFYAELVRQFEDGADYVTDGKWLEKHVKLAVDRALEKIYKTIDKLVESFDDLVKANKITKEGRDELKDQLYNAYNNNPGMRSEYIERIVKNLKSPPGPKLDEVTSYGDIEDVKGRLEEVMKDENVNMAMLTEAIYREKVIYEKVEKDDVSDKDLNRLGFASENLMVPNPNGYYKQSELGYLRNLREMLVKGKAVPLTSSGHVVTALDVKMHNNRWFVLIRDPFNTYRYEYTQKDDGKVEKKDYGLFSAISKHRDIKKLSPNMKDGFLGTCWWELKDVYKSFGYYVLDH